jgi:signal transduction histidine kinase
MLGRLQASGDRQRAFISDASHELRSPVAGIKVQLETALREDEHDTFGQALRTALGEVDRLERLVANLLALSRLDEGLSGPRGEVDVDDLVLEAGTRVGAGRIDLSGVSGGRVWGNRDELDGVVRNLLENAVRHANDRVEASVRVEGAGPDGGGLVVLTVDDDGAGISESDHEVVFERFGRLDEGRSRDAGGSGLGLALVKRVVESHDGTVSVTGSPLGGARFVVRLPAV